MNSAAAPFDAVFERLFLRVQSCKTGQQTGMDVQYAMTKGRDERRGQQAQVASQANQVYSLFPQRGDDLSIVFFTSPDPSFNHARRQAQFLSAAQAKGGWLVADHDNNLCLLESTLAHGVSERHHVRAAAGDQNANPRWRIARWIECHEFHPEAQRPLRKSGVRGLLKPHPASPSAKTF